MEDRNALIRHIEELSMNAWPAHRTTLLDGWVLRFSDGYTRRANCVNPLYIGARRDSGDASVDRCEALYASVGQDVVFKMTDASPTGLDTLLEARGYSFEAETSLQRCKLAGDDLSKQPAQNFAIRLDSWPSDAWMEAFTTMASVDARNRSSLNRILAGIVVPDVAFAAAQVEDEIIAVGLGVAERGYVGLFDIATAPSWRRRGAGTAIVRALMAWGRSCGAESAYLQVMRNNLPASALYAWLGFSEEYRYWYRVRPPGAMSRMG